MVAVLAAAAIWGLVAARRGTLLGMAVVLLAFSGFALYTLVLDEQYLDKDLNGRLDDLVLIGVPAVLGIGIMLALMRTGRRRA